MTADEIHDENVKAFAEALGECADAITVKPQQLNGHTPGPWELNSVFGPSTGALSVTHPTWKNNSHPIARVYRRLMDDRREDGTHQFDDAEAQANANLIAAAPEMLEALTELLDRLDVVRFRGWVGHPLMNKGRAAIAKAKGRAAP